MHPNSPEIECKPELLLELDLVRVPKVEENGKRRHRFGSVDIDRCSQFAKECRCGEHGGFY